MPPSIASIFLRRRGQFCFKNFACFFETILASSRPVAQTSDKTTHKTPKTGATKPHEEVQPSRTRAHDRRRILLRRRLLALPGRHHRLRRRRRLHRQGRPRGRPLLQPRHDVLRHGHRRADRLLLHAPAPQDRRDRPLHREEAPRRRQEGVVRHPAPLPHEPGRGRPLGRRRPLLAHGPRRPVPGRLVRALQLHRGRHRHHRRRPDARLARHRLAHDRRRRHAAVLRHRPRAGHRRGRRRGHAPLQRPVSRLAAGRPPEHPRPRRPRRRLGPRREDRSDRAPAP